MRKTRRFIRNIAKKLTIFAVVFVALINACFYCPMQVQAADSTLLSFLDSFYYGSSLGVLCLPDTDFNLITVTSPVVSTNNTPVIIDGSTTENTSRFDFSVQTVTFSNLLKTNLSSFFEGGYACINGSITLANNFYFSPSVSQGSRLYLESVDLITSSGVAVPFVYQANVIDRGNGNYGLYVEIILAFTNFQVSNLSSYLNLFSVTYNFIGYTAQSTNYCNFTIQPVKFSSGGTVSPGPAPGSSVDITDGYDDSAGNQVSSDFESSVGSYNEAEDSIFTSSESALDGFSFFDWSGYTGIATGVSFVSSLMVSIYNNFGGMSGIGIVLSVLFSVMFLAIVIGLYRYFK